MKVNWTGRLLVSAVFLTSLLPGAVTAKTKYPAELEFLSRIKPPTCYYAMGVIEEMDSTNQTISQMPFVFYWEKGVYVLDVRLTGGTPFLFGKGVADTIWFYGFQQGVKLVMLRNENAEWLSQLPIRIGDLLPVFNILPKELADPDTFYYGEGSHMIVRLKDGASYEFDVSSRKLLTISRDESVIRSGEFLSHGGMMWPQRVELNKGLTSGASGRIQINIREVSFRRQPEREFFSVPLPEQMPRVFDMRPQATDGD